MSLIYIIKSSRVDIWVSTRDGVQVPGASYKTKHRLESQKNTQDWDYFFMKKNLQNTCKVQNYKNYYNVKKSNFNKYICKVRVIVNIFSHVSDQQSHQERLVFTIPEKVIYLGNAIRILRIPCYSYPILWQGNSDLSTLLIDEFAKNECDFRRTNYCRYHLQLPSIKK